MKVFYREGDPLPEQGIGRDCQPLTDAIIELAKDYTNRQVASSTIEIFLTVAMNASKREQHAFLYILREAQKTILQAQQASKK
jgi:hypothetical protein